MATAMQVRKRPQGSRAGFGNPVRIELRLKRRPEPQFPTPAKLQEVEERLLAEAIERHPGRERAITHLLNDLERPAGLNQPRKRVMLAGSPTRAQRMEDLMFEAVVGTHPNRGVGIDRLLGDVVGDAADIDEGTDECIGQGIVNPLGSNANEIDEEMARALSEMSVDNDFDGMG